MLRSLIVWCLLTPLLCVFAVGIVASAVVVGVTALVGLLGVRVLRWGER